MYFNEPKKEQSKESSVFKVVENPKPITKIKKGVFKPKTPKLTNFTVHDADIKSLFEKANLKQNDIFRLVVQPDTHCPEHDQNAIGVFCQFLEYYKPHGIVNLGDFLEMKSVARWNPSDPSPKRIVPEIKIGISVLSKIDKALGSQCVYRGFLIGNHEDWLQQYLNEKIPEVLDGLEELGTKLTIDELLGLKKFGYETVPLNEILQIGDANFIHGYYTGKHHAAKHLDVFGVNIYYGHVHDVQSHSGVSVKGLHESMSLGCLRTLQAPFLKGKPNNWSHAFGIFEIRNDGSYTRYVPIMINGRMSFNGKIFSASDYQELVSY